MEILLFGKIVLFVLVIVCIGKVFGSWSLRKNLPKSNWKDRQMLVLHIVIWSVILLLVFGFFVFLLVR